MAKIMESPLELKSKVSEGGAVSTEMLARGDAAIAEFQLSTPVWHFKTSMSLLP